MPNKPSQDEALKKMDRSQLIEVIYALQRIEKRLIRERNDLRRKLHEANSAEGLHQSSADEIDAANTAAAQIIDQAKATAEKYLESVRDMAEKAKIANINVVEAAEKQALTIIHDAEMQAQLILDEASAQATDGDTLDDMPTGLSRLDDLDTWDLGDDGRDLTPENIYMNNLKDEEDFDYYSDLPYEARISDSLEGVGPLDLVSFDDDEGPDSLVLDERDVEEVRIRPEDVMAPTVMITIGEEKLWEEEELAEKDPIPERSDLVSDFDPVALYPDEIESQIAAFESEYARSFEEGDLDSDLDDELFEERADLDSIDDDTSQESALGEEDDSGDDPDVSINDSADGAEGDASDDGPDIFGDDAFEGAISETDEGSDESSEDASADAGQDGPKESVKQSDEDASSDKESDGDEMAAFAQELRAHTTTDTPTEPFEPLDPSVSSILSMTKAERKAAKKAAKKAKRAAKRSGNPRLEKKKAEESPEELDDKKVVQAKEMLKTMSVPEIMQSSYESFTNANLIHESMVSDFDYEAYLDEAEDPKNASDDGDAPKDEEK